MCTSGGDRDKQELVQGRERTVWNPELSIQRKQFDFAARIKTAIETWDGYVAAVDRRWLEPLIEAIYSPEDLRRGWSADPKAQ